MFSTRQDKLNFASADARFRWRIALLNLVLSLSAFSVLSQPVLVDTLDGVALKAAFALREATGMAPKLSSELKIFALDDKTTTITRMGDFGFSGWSYVIEALQSRQPRAIVIDKIFALSTGQANAGALAKTLDSSLAPVHVGAFLTNQEIEGRVPLDHVPKDFPSIQLSESAHDMIRGRHFAYGPLPELAPHFRGIGHISIEANAKYKPLSVTSSGVMTAHLSLLTTNTIRAEGQSIQIDGRLVHLDRTGRIPANLIAPQHLRQQTLTMATLLKDNEKRKLILDNIKPSDIVLLLPQMFTGNTDFKDTAFGTMEGGYILAAAINSALTGQWLSTYELPSWAFLLIGLAVYGSLTCLPLKLVRNLYLTTIFLSVFAFFFAFSVMSTYLPLLTIAINLSFLILPNYFILTRRHELRSQAIITSLGSSMGRANIEKIVESPDLVLRAPEEKHMTILFLDMVGFSVMSDRKSPEELFSTLKENLRMIEAIVHKHGGIVDKVLGDGVMCFFGFDLTLKNTSSGSKAVEKNHAEQAVRCALEIQARSAELCASGTAAIVFPYRIGINTDRISFGDLGGDERIEFSCIGRGVNFAARLESCADPFKILLGEGTHAALKDIHDLPAAIEKKIQIKHYSEFFDVFEISPFEQGSGLLAQALDAYRQSHGIAIQEPRYALSADLPIQIFIERLPAHILDISESGLGVEGPHLYGRGALVEIEIIGLDDSALRFVTEVKNSGLEAGRKRMGLMIKNLKGTDRQKLCAQLRSISQNAEVKTGLSASA